MAGSISDYLENKLLDHVLKVASFSQPTIYMGLSTADPQDDGSGLAEPSGNGYARVATPNWGAAANRSISNDAVINFPEATGSWGTITHYAIFDAISGGNMLAHGDLPESKTIGAGDNPSITIGNATVSFNSGGISDDLANKLLDHIFENSEYTQPTNIYVALATGAIGDSDTGNTITEPSGNGYARENHNAYDTASGGASENTGIISFGPATPAGWGTVTHICLVDASTAGNILFYATLDNSRNIGVGDTAEFADGAFNFTLS